MCRVFSDVEDELEGAHEENVDSSNVDISSRTVPSDDNTQAVQADGKECT